MIEAAVLSRAGDIILWIGYALLIILLLPIVVVPVLGMTLSLLDGGQGRWRRREWKRLQEEQLEARTSPLHGWVAMHPASLFEGLLSLERPVRTGRDRWRVGTLDGEPIELVGPGRSMHFLNVAMAPDAEPSDWFTWRKRAARLIVDAKLRTRIAAVDDEAVLAALMADMNGWLPRLIELPVPLTADMLQLYRAVAHVIPSGGPSDEVGEESLEARRVAYYTSVWGEPPMPECTTIPPGRWRAVTSFEESDYYLPDNEDDAHWGDDESLMNVLLYNDGSRTLELRFHPHEGVQILGCYETPLEFVKQAVLHRAADEVERQLGAAG